MQSVAIQGTVGSYSEEAARKLLGANARIQGFSSFFETFQALLIKSVDYAVIPVRNSIVGEISSATSFYSRSDLDVLEEIPLDIRHLLVGTPDSRIDEIRSVRSHVEAIRQCSGFFKRNQHIEPTVGADTASSIRRVVSEDARTIAAIGSRRAAEIYGGKILSENVADGIKNQTTFYLIGQ
ncbi:MAG: hypothetical protein HKN25_04420 [Pyrinomonadaceae bacterium]|nr:hypothetical protein [Pyrinomonadaceae bacterium]